MSFSSIADSSTCGGTCAGGDWTIGLWEQDPNWLATFPGIATGNTRFDTTPVRYLNNPPTCSSDANCPAAVDPQNSELGNASYCKVAAVSGYPSGTKFCVQEHLTQVAASVGMKGSYTYPAPDPRGSFSSGAGTGSVDFYVGNQSGIQGFDYLMSNSLTYVNRSMSGVTGALAAAIDWSARYDSVLTTLASGNTGTQTVQCRQSWNSLCVGSYDYQAWNSSSDDRRSSFSSYLNATNVPVIGLERPHLLGPGNYFAASDGLYLPDIRSTSSTMIDELLYDPAPLNHYQLVGTSFAAPAVLSVALAAHQHEGWFSNLAYPIVRKAVVMAATVDANGDGEVKAGYLWSASGDGQDGTGHPSGTRLNVLLDNNRYRLVSLSDSSFVSCGATCREYTVTTVTAAPNQRIKAALVWNACSTGYSVTADLVNDLDLVVQRPAFVTCSGTRQSIAAISEVEAVYDECLSGTGIGGTYTLKIRIKDGLPLAACNGSGVERAAVAWSLF